MQQKIRSFIKTLISYLRQQKVPGHLFWEQLFISKGDLYKLI